MLDVRMCVLTYIHIEKNADFPTLVLMCGFALSVMLLTLAVVLPTPHDYSGTLQGGNSARFTASRRVLKGARKGPCTLQKHPRVRKALARRSALVTLTGVLAVVTVTINSQSTWTTSVRPIRLQVTYEMRWSFNTRNSCQLINFNHYSTNV